MKFSGRIKDIVSDFEYLERTISDIEAEKYYTSWMDKYRRFYKNCTEEEGISMAIRSQKARRNIISSAKLFEEAKVARREGCVSATFFLVYYSFFHAMWAVLLLNPEENDSVHEVTHSKLRNRFCDLYTRGNFFDEPMLDFINDLKNMRECFSYHVPFNIIGDFKDFDLMEDMLLKCYQLAHLHNSMLGVCSHKIAVTVDNYKYFEECYNMFNYRETESGKKELDPSEKNQFYEILNYGMFIVNFEIEMGHDWDEMGYSTLMDGKFDKKPVYEIQASAMALVYKAITYV